MSGSGSISDLNARRAAETTFYRNVVVVAGAGTGKTVAAMHRVKWLAQQVFTGANDRILFTTFTRNLAADIRENLLKICSEEAMRRIEVVNLDKWVSDFLHRYGYHYEIDYGKRTASLWEQALTVAPGDVQVPTSFYREEWERYARRFVEKHRARLAQGEKAPPTEPFWLEMGSPLEWLLVTEEMTARPVAG